VLAFALPMQRLPRDASVINQRAGDLHRRRIREMINVGPFDRKNLVRPAKPPILVSISPTRVSRVNTGQPACRGLSLHRSYARMF
jgi:hypothetical protein